MMKRRRREGAGEGGGRRRDEAGRGGGEGGGGGTNIKMHQFCSQALAYSVKMHVFFDARTNTVKSKRPIYRNMREQNLRIFTRHPKA